MKTTENDNQNFLLKTELDIKTNDDDDYNTDGIAEGDFEKNKTEPNRTFFNRYFSKMEPGSLRASIFTLSIVSIGIGCLTLPKVLTSMSITGGIIFILLGGLLAYWTLNILIQAGRLKQLSVYSHVIEAYLGKSFALIYDVTISFTLYGVIIIYTIIFYDMISAFSFVFISEDDKNIYNNKIDEYQKGSVWGELYFKVLIMCGFGILVFPLMIKKDLSSLRFSTVAGIFALLIVMVILVIELPWYLINYYDNIYDKNDESTFYNWYDISKGFTDKLLFIRGLATINLAFNVHSNIFMVYQKLYNNNNKRTKKVVGRSVLLDTIVFLTFAVVGHLTQHNTPGIILSRNPLPGSLDIPMSIGRLLICLLVLCKVPVLYNAARLSVINIIWNDTEITLKRNLLITIPSLIIIILIGIFYADVGDVVDIVGGYFGVFTCVTLPGMIQLIIYKDLSFFNKKKLIVIIILGGVTILGFIAGTLTVIDIIKKIVNGKN